MTVLTKRMFTPHNVSHVTCHVSHVTCQVSNVFLLGVGEKLAFLVHKINMVFADGVEIKFYPIFDVLKFEIEIEKIKLSNLD